MKSEFKEFQEDVCTEVTKIEPDVSKFCPTCIPDPSYVVPNWWNTKNPFLNKKTCEYSTIASINKNGDTYTHSTISSADMSFEELLESYKEVGLNYLLNHYNKVNIDQIDGVPLIDYVKASDYHFYSFSDSIMVVLITFPANVFDTIEEQPIIDTIEELEEKSLTISTKDLIIYMKRLKLALEAYSNFQALFYQLESGKVIFKDTKRPFYLRFYPDRIDSFLSEMERILELNGYDYGLLNNPLREAEKINFRFETSASSGIFKIKTIKAKKTHTKFKTLKKGLVSFFRSGATKDATLIAFLANIRKINVRLNARKSPSWINFVEQFVFPKVEIVNKSSVINDTGLRCLNKQLTNLDDFLLDKVLSFTDVFAYQLNKANKKSLGDINKTPDNPSGLNIRAQINEFSIKVEKDRKKLKLKKSNFCIADKIRNFKNNSEEFLQDILASLDPCKFKEIAGSAMSCIMANLDFETAFGSIVKKVFSNITADAMEVLLLGLPESVRSDITEEVRLKIRNQPAPWEEEFRAGPDEEGPGTVGKFLGEFQRDATEAYSDAALQAVASKTRHSESEILKIYEEAILKFATLQEIVKSFDNLPGFDVLTKFIGTGGFPTTHFINPPINSFLNTLTFDPCGKEKLSLTIPQFNFDFNFSGWSWVIGFGKLAINVIKFTIKELILSLLITISVKIKIELPSMGELSCKALHSAGGKVGSILTGKEEIGDILSKAICDDPLGIAEKDNLTHRILKQAGAVTDKFKEEVSKINPVAGGIDFSYTPSLSTFPLTDDQRTLVEDGIDYLKDRFDEEVDSIVSNLSKGRIPYVELAKAISVSSTKNEIIRAITLPEEEIDSSFIRNMTNTLPIIVPEFASSFDTEEKTKDFFLSVGSLLTPDQRASLQSEVSPDDDVKPLEDTICLTDEELRNWNKERQNAFENSGLQPELAKEFVEKQNDRIKSDLEDIVELFANGPDELLKSAIDDVLGTDDPCVNPNSVVRYQDTPAEQIVSDAISGVFKKLQRSFIDDTIEWNLFERLVDSPGILSLILADKKGFTLNYHNIVGRSRILKLFLPDPGEDPETVCIQMYKYINKNNPIVLSDSQINFVYSNEAKEKDLYTSLIQLKEDPNSTTAHLKINTPIESYSFNYNQFVIEDYDKVFTNSSENFKRTATVSKYLKSQWRQFTNISFDGDVASKFVKNVNSLLFEKLFKKLLDRKDHTYSHGFIYSSKVEKITKQDLEYVGPDGLEYNYEEEESVLGESATGNERVVFLDPSDHGGTYNNPNFFIKPQEQIGWKKISKIFMPTQEDGKKKVTFLNIPEITETINITRSSIRPDPRLQASPDDLVQIPFDKVTSPSNFSILEGSIIATIRVYLADFFMRSAPITTNISLDLDSNYDDAMVSFVVQMMRKRMIAQTESQTSIYTGYVYWLLFLEQVTQVFDRRYRKLMEDYESKRDSLTDEEKAIEREYMNHDTDLLKILSAQNNHIEVDKEILSLLKDETIWNLNSPESDQSEDARIEVLKSTLREYEDNDYFSSLSTGKKEISKIKKELQSAKEKSEIYKQRQRLGDSITRGSMIIGYGEEYWKSFGLSREQWKSSIIPVPTSKKDQKFGFIGGSSFGFKFSDIDAKHASFATKMFTINVVEQECTNILKFMIRQEIKSYKSTIADEIEPEIENVEKFFFGESGAMIKSPMIGKSEEKMTNIMSCVSNPETENPLDGIQVSIEEVDQLRKTGSFFFEKYVRIIEKDGSPFAGRDPLLKGIVSPSKFKEFLKQNSFNVDMDKPISSYFGNVKLIADKSVLNGTIGIKFGVRLCYLPSEDMNLDFLSEQNKKSARNKKSFIFKQAKVQAKPEAISKAFEVAKENSDEAMLLLTAAVPGLGAALTLAGVGGDEFEKVMEIVEGLIPLTTLSASRHIFPVCSFEQDLRDESLSFYANLPDNNFNQDLSCYVDGIFNSEGFKLLFGKLINIKKVPSILSVYSYMNFLAALGVDSSEREDSDETQINLENLGRIFNDSKKELRKLFMAAYIRDQFDEEDDNTKDDPVNKSKNKRMQETLDAVELEDDVPWLYKFRQKLDNPFVKFGFLAKNKYHGLFEFLDPEK